MKFISDDKLIKIPVRENNEALVDLRKVCPNIKIVIDDLELDERFYNVRETVAKKLNRIQAKLKVNQRLVVFSAYRPIEVQRSHYEAMLKRVKDEEPNLSDLEARKVASRWIAPPDIIPPHTAGAAVDLSIEESGVLFAMGTKYKQFNDKTQTDSSKITMLEKQNREYLVELMEAEGFVNYPTEWWHFSYGDRYWAAQTKTQFSIYNSI